MKGRYSSISISVFFNSWGNLRGKDCWWKFFFLGLQVVVPEFVMLITEEDHCTAGLDVKRRGGVFDGVIDAHQNAGVGDGRFF